MQQRLVIKVGFALWNFWPSWFRVQELAQCCSRRLIQTHVRGQSMRISSRSCQHASNHFPYRGSRGSSKDRQFYSCSLEIIYHKLKDRTYCSRPVSFLQTSWKKNAKELISKIVSICQCSWNSQYFTKKYSKTPNASTLTSNILEITEWDLCRDSTSLPKRYVGRHSCLSLVITQASGWELCAREQRYTCILCHSQDIQLNIIYFIRALLL